MSTQPLKPQPRINAADIAKLLERVPGFLHDVAGLKARIAERGSITLADLAVWQLEHSAGAGAGTSAYAELERVARLAVLAAKADIARQLESEMFNDAADVVRCMYVPSLVILACRAAEAACTQPKSSGQT